MGYFEGCKGEDSFKDVQRFWMLKEGCTMFLGYVRYEGIYGGLIRRNTCYSAV